MANTNKTFKGKIQLRFQDNQDNIIDIDPNRIIYMMIDYDYVNNIIPTIILSISVNLKLYNMIASQYDRSKFILELKGNNTLSSNSIDKIKFNDIFQYIPSSANEDYRIIEDPETYVDSYKEISIGLVSMKMLNIMRTTFNGVYKNVLTKDLVNIALEGINNVCIEPVKYDRHYDELVVPVCDSRYKLLEFLFDKESFYDTQFRLFMDFKRCYLLSQSGYGIKTSDSSINDVIMNIRKIDDPTSFSNGYTVSNNAYIVNVNQTNCTIKVNTSRQKAIDKIVGFNDFKDPESFKYNNTEENYNGLNEKALYIREKDEDSLQNVVKNMIDNSQVRVEVIDQNIDPDIFQINNSYSLKFNGSNDEYSGKYLLLSKKVFYKNNSSGEFLITTDLGFAKIEDNLPKVANSYKNKKSGIYETNKNKATSKSATTSSTSNTVFEARKRSKNK